MKSRPFVCRFCCGIVNVALSAVLSAVLTASLQATSIVTNGNFEQLKVSGVSSQFGTYYASQQVTGWSTAGYNFVFTPGTADTTGAAGQYGKLYLWGPKNGSNNGLTTSPAAGNFLAFDGGTHVGAVSQTISGLKIGKYVDVSFYYAAAQQYGFNAATTEQFKVSLGGQTDLTPVLSIVNHGFSGWHYETLSFKATSSSEVLSFLASGTPTGVPPFALLDGVSMSITPEPATWALVLLGGAFSLAGLAYARRKSLRRSRPT
jgi:hypothetical protein